MKAIIATLTQAIVITVIALSIGLGTNAVRGKDHISLSRQYIPPKTIPATDTQPSAPEGEPGADASPQPPSHPYHEINVKQAAEIFEDDNTDYGLYVFVDARADDAYEDGHIPGAVQCDYYRIDYYFPDVLMRAGGAEKIVVYCNGGDCEDSLYVCGELLLADVPKAKIYLFKGGWQAWKNAGLPVEEGRTESE